MQKLFFVNVLFLTIVLFLDNGHSFNCYQCRTDMDDGCDGPIDQKYSKACPGESPIYCRKIKQQLRFKDQKSFTSIRECAYEARKSGCYIFKWYKLARMETCECDTENCNRGSSHIPGIIAVVFSVLWIFAYLKSNGT